MKFRYSAPVFAALFGLVAQAQPNLTSSADVPLNGDEFATYAAENFISEGAAGANVVYDYWNMLVPNTGLRNYRWFNASVSSNASLVPSATLLSTDGGTDTMYWAVTANGLEQVGARTVLYGGTISYGDAMLELKLPCTFGTTWSDPHSANYAISGFPVTRTGTITGHADAYGTLTMPSAQQHQVLRVKVRRDLTDVSAFATSVRRETVFSYYQESGRAPKLRLQVDSLQINGGAWAVTRRAEWTGNSFTVGIDDLDDATVFTAYPNPASGPITLSAPAMAGSRVELVDATGRLVETNTLTGERVVIGTDALRAGVYNLVLTTPSGQRTAQRVVVE